MAAKHGLGRGLDALIRNGTTAPAPAPAAPAEPAAPAAPAAAAPAGGVRKVPISSVRRSPWQPRRTFEPEAMAELVDSIRQRGVIQPLLVRTCETGYELIAGERRFRAATEAGLQELPVIVMDAADRDALELALIENLQRADLNIIEEAEGYQLLADRFNLTQEEVSQRVGKARVSVTNALRLLGLPTQVKQWLAGRQLSPGHAKVLSGVENEAEVVALAENAVSQNLSVRDLEKLVRKLKRAPRKPRAAREDIPRAHLAYLSDQLHARFGTSIRITPCRTYANGKKGKGMVEIDFYSNDDLDRILSILGVTEE